ncbi:carotenoid biosynthesis protein [uncultured Fibrella sp.]|uniref:carotenoid biosynthesis protein n=1 Tax=uncultured Fibrella sp. TaxID=1284596 RepID=UPI0035CBFA02
MVDFPVPRHDKIIRTILVLAYIAGLIGLQIPAVAPLFKQLTALNLLGTLAALLWYHTDWRPAFTFYIALAVLTGYFVELLGVRTGYVFGGPYAYGAGLGPKLFDIPPIIGANWLLLTYCFGSVFDRFSWPIYLKTAIAAAGMVALDLMVEPVAIRLDFWTWFGHTIPIQNYLGWWLVSVALLSIWYGLPFRKENRLSLLIISLQVFFFVGHQLLYRLAIS